MVIFTEVHILVNHCRFGVSGLCDGDVRHITGVGALRIHQSVFLVVRIEVGAGGLKVRYITLWDLMNMNSMLARRKISQVEPDLYAVLLGTERCGSDALAISILQMDDFFAVFGRSQ